jgi:hypothetical protein
MDELLNKVPPAQRAKLSEIASHTDKFCEVHLNAEYRDICRELIVIASNAGITFGSGKAQGWAAGIIATIGYVNFFGDPTQPYHMSNAEIAKGVGTSLATLQSKTKIIRETLDIQRLDPQFSSQELNERNPFVWTILINNLAVDIRTAPREEQEEAFRQGQIPYIPSDGSTKAIIRHWIPTDIEPEPGSKTKKKAKKKATGPIQLYTLEVSIIGGPIAPAFAKKYPKISRTIEIRGDQTLVDLHEAIFDAFDRDDEHLYEFQFGKKPMARNAPRYVVPEAMEPDGVDSDVAGSVDETTIDELELRVKRRFWYWFDFGDDWHHQIEVVEITEAPPKGKYPRVIHKAGKSPPQYTDDWD